MISAYIWMPLLAYLLGSIPTGWIVAKLFFKTDIRSGGSGNIGATNALRQFGTTTGVVVLLIDMAKGILAVSLARYVFEPGHPLLAVCGLLAILGHVFPVWLGFKGGKGVATAGGVFLALAPFSLLVTLLVFIVIVAITRYVSLGSIIGALVFLLMIMFNVIASIERDWALLILVVLVVAMIILKHRQNITRLMQGSEHKISFGKKGKA